MKLCVLDCSFAIAWVFEDEATGAADELLARLVERDSVVVPAVLFGLEVANVLRGAVVRKRITRNQAEEKRRFLEALPLVEVTPPNGLGGAILDLAMKHALTTYDAAYLALAVEEKLPLATKDDALRAAAKAAHVSLWREREAR